MGIRTQLRRPLSALALGLLVVALASAEAVSCGNGLAPPSGGCCNSDGSCKTTPDTDPPACCLKAGANEVVAVAQPSRERPVAASPLATDAASTVRIRHAVPISVAPVEYSPLRLFLLDSALLI